jgi:hypothetical protein
VGVTAALTGNAFGMYIGLGTLLLIVIVVLLLRRA